MKPYNFHCTLCNYSTHCRAAVIQHEKTKKHIINYEIYRKQIYVRKLEFKDPIINLNQVEILNRLQDFPETKASLPAYQSHNVFEI